MCKFNEQDLVASINKHSLHTNCNLA